MEEEQGIKEELLEAINLAKQVITGQIFQLRNLQARLLEIEALEAEPNLELLYD